MESRQCRPTGADALQDHPDEKLLLGGALHTAGLVLVATPIDLARIIKIDRPNLRVSYKVEELTRPGLSDRLVTFMHDHQPATAGV